MISQINLFISLLLISIISVVMYLGIIYFRTNISKLIKMKKEIKNSFFNNFQTGIISAASFFVLIELANLIKENLPSFNTANFSLIITSLIIYVILIAFGFLFILLLINFLIYVGLKNYFSK